MRAAGAELGCLHLVVNPGSVVRNSAVHAVRAVLNVGRYYLVELYILHWTDLGTAEAPADLPDEHGLVPHLLGERPPAVPRAGVLRPVRGVSADLPSLDMADKSSRHLGVHHLD